MISAAPLPEQIARFRSDLARLWDERGLLGLAVSGGPDSLALLLLAAAAYPGKIAVATVDHGLRSEAAEEAVYVAALCARLGCSHEILAVSVSQGGAGLQGEARRARYASLETWAKKRGIGTLLTAHHADDQAETLLMRLQRGSGIAGLSGVRPARKMGDSLLVARPLLAWQKAELRAIVADAGVEAIEDPSNQDPRFDRARVRNLLAATPSFDPLRLARSAAALGEANEAIEWMADYLWQERCTYEDGTWTLDTGGLPRELCRRLLARAVADLHARQPLESGWTGAEDVEGLLRTLERGGKATRAGVMAKGGASWVIRPAPPRRLRR